MHPGRARIALTPGEPAGIGPELMVRLAREGSDAERILVSDPDLIAARAGDTPLDTYTFDPAQPARAQQPGEIAIAPLALARPARPGVLDSANARHVLATLEHAAAGCRDGTFDALVTGPVHKGIINEAGIAFSGHTEFLAGDDHPLMLLAAGDLRVALVTTHMPLAEVPAHIRRERVERSGDILARDLERCFGLVRPRILVLGLNPHAGEGGHLGREDGEEIAPAVSALRARGIEAIGPVPADTAFTPASLAAADAVLAMYHDQGLPVLKHAGFGRAVNITLGLPFIRTSVDHGTALELAGTGRADAGSLQAAFAMAVDMVARVRAAGTA